MGQKYAPSSKVGSLNEISRFIECSKTVFEKRKQIEHSIWEWKRPSNENELAVEAKHKDETQKQIGYSTLKGKGIAISVSVAITALMFVISIISRPTRASAIGSAIYLVYGVIISIAWIFVMLDWESSVKAKIILGLLTFGEPILMIFRGIEFIYVTRIVIGVLSLILMYFFSDFFEEAIKIRILRNSKRQKLYSEELAIARAKDREQTAINQKVAPEKIRELEDELKAFDSQYGELMKGWEQTIAKAKFETIHIGFAQGLSEEEIFEKLLFYVPLNANTYGEAMQGAFNRLRNDWVEGKAAYDRCNSILNSM